MTISSSGSQIYAKTTHDPSAGLLSSFSPLQKERAEWEPDLPTVLLGPVKSIIDTSVQSLNSDEDQKVLKELFPHTSNQSYVKLEPSSEIHLWKNHPPLRIGVVLSGGQAPGGHNVIAGIFDYAKQCNPNSQVFGFLGGPHGVFTSKYKEIDAEFMNRYRNQGGFHMIKSGRHKIETEQQKSASLQICQKLALHGLVVIGGDDSNTNAAILAEYFKEHQCSTCVIGCPKTIDGDLKNEYIETPFGFDTATKTYSELIGNLMTDVATSRNRYHFVRLMGRSASNIALECALQTRPNFCLIGEEIQQKNRSLKSIVDEIVDLIQKRAELDKTYGIVLVPEGLIEFIPELGCLIRELNELLGENKTFDSSKLSAENYKIFNEIPELIRKTLLIDRDPHGNVQVSKIATEQLLILMIQKQLEQKNLSHVFRATAHYFGYEGRCAMPSTFDANYCYALGHTAGALIDNNLTGYMAVVRYLSRPSLEWEAAGCPLQSMMTIERRNKKNVPVIKKYVVDLNQPLFQMYSKVREHWKTGDFYCNPGPEQFSGSCTKAVNYLVKLPKEEDLLPPVPFNLEVLKRRYNFIKSETYMSPLQRERLKAKIEISPILTNPYAQAVPGPKCPIYDQQGQKFVNRAFPLQCKRHKMKIYNVIHKNPALLQKQQQKQHHIHEQFDSSILKTSSKYMHHKTTSTGKPQQQLENKIFRVGVVLQGQQAPGSSNVLHGLFERLKLVSYCSVLIGFKGVTGLLEQDYIEITKEDLKLYFNQGGFELLGRTKQTKALMRTEDGLEKVFKTCQQLNLNGLVMIGGQTSLTDAALLTEYFLCKQCPTCVIGVPATQENNLRHSLIEACIGFDSTSKCYSSLVGNLLIDAASATKYWYFVRLMGQVPSHMVLEAAFQTHPNMSIISEKYADLDQTLFDVVQDIANVVCARANQNKNFGTVLIPEGLISQLPHLRQLFSQLNAILHSVSEEDYDQLHDELVKCEEESKTGHQQFLTLLDPWVLAVWKSLPQFFREQIIQKSGIDIAEVSIEQLLSQMVSTELERRKITGEFKGTFAPVCHYLGFQGRSTMPSLFDCRLGLSYGYLACIAIEANLTGYVTSIRGLCGHYSTWKLSVVPISAVMKVMPQREMKAYGRDVPMVPCAEVDLRGKAYIALKNVEEQWEQEDCFCNPGPIQFSGAASHFYNRTLFEEQHSYIEMLRELESLTNYIETVCTFGVDETTLRTTVLSLEGLTRILQHSQSGLNQ